MKNIKKGLPLLCLFLCILFCGCSVNTEPIPEKENETTANTSETETVSLSELQEENKSLKEKIEKYNMIYQESLEESIETYCKYYLSYTGTAVKNIEKLEPFVTDMYYSELCSKTGHAQNTNNYEQSTAIDTIYYSENSSPSEFIEVMVTCYQSIIYDNTAKTQSAAYIFNMKYIEGKWLINSVEKPEI